MAKDYGRNRPQRRGNTGSKQFLMVLLAFLIGYLTASVFDFVSLSHWINTTLMAQQNNATTNANPVVAKKAELPKPKFEFYTLLANGRTLPPSPKIQEKPPTAGAKIDEKPATTIQSSQVVDNKTSLPKVITTSIASATKESYIIQVGSFKTTPEAERMKASLILKGFSVSIVPVTQAHVTWYRIIIGPYNSHADAQRAQLAFAQNEHVKGMIRKV
jgi:cell division protein FtsN